MVHQERWLALLTAAALWIVAGGTARADRVEFHFSPTYLGGTTTLKPPLPGGVRTSWFGTVREPYAGRLRPTHMVTFRHPYTGRHVIVPMALPLGTPRIEHRGSGVIFNYGSYTVEARFLSDGSVDTIYNSGPLRPL